MIRDTAGERLLSAYVTMETSDVKTVTIAIEANTGYSLSGTAVDDIAVEAREEGGGAWTNIETTPISLTPWDGTTQNFEIRLTAGTITSHLRRAFTLTVGR